MPCVSVIVPTYNVQDYLDECLQSLVKQTLKDIEIVCVNDGSTDESLAILEKYQALDPRIRIVDQPNGGYGKAMNAGIDAAQGDYIGIVEPDDFVLLDMYEELYAKAIEHDLDMVKADFYRFTRNENGDMHLAYNHLDDKHADYGQVFDPSQDPRRLLYIMNTWSGIYKRSFLNDHGIRHNESPGASFQDNGLYFQSFVYAKRAMIIDKPFYMNRRDNPNSSVKDPTKAYCMNDEYAFIRDIIIKDPDAWGRFKGMLTYMKYHSYFTVLNRVTDEIAPDYIRHVSKEFNEAEQLGELDPAPFWDDEWARIRNVMDDPEGFIVAFAKSKEPQREDRLGTLRKLKRRLTSR